MTGRGRQAGLRPLQIMVTGVVLVAWVIVIARVSSCIGDAECTFAPRAIENAILAFVGGPLVLIAAWGVPVAARRRDTGWPAWAWMTVGSLGAASLVVGMILAGGGWVAATVLMTAGPGTLIAGVTGLVATAPSAREEHPE